ncbi:MAG: hypothetical protein H8D52_03810 [Gammaproteobacteria bacterium]|nr:hypothetical protein [Gammaproteobacteria bacterium]
MRGAQWTTVLSWSRVVYNAVKVNRVGMNNMLTLIFWDKRFTAAPLIMA